MTISVAVQRFRDLVKDDEFVQRGQFTWYSKFRAELVARYDSLLGADPVTEAVLQGVGGTTDAAALREAILESIRAYKPTETASLIRATVARLEGTPTASRGSNHAAIRTMFAGNSGRWGSGVALYDTVEALFCLGKRFRKGDVTASDLEDREDAINFRTYFLDPTMLTFSIADSLHNTCAIKCGHVVDHLNLHIDRRTSHRGLRGVKSPGHVRGISMQIAYQVTPLGGNAGDILIYRSKLGGNDDSGTMDGPIFAVKKNLDNGLLVAAHVLSGITGPELEHWIALLAYEETSYGCRFVFWDPDAAVSTRESFGSGFGFLHFVTGAAAPIRGGVAGLGARFSNGRLSTESTDNGVLCDPATGNHLDLGGGSVIQHRYQVGAMVFYAT